MIRKEMIQLLRDRRTLVLVLVLPFVELFLLAYAVDLTVDHIPTAVADLSRDGQSQALIDALAVSGFFDIESYLADESQLIRAIDEGRVRAAILIPPDFAARVERGTAQVLILLDGSDSFTVQSGYSAALAITQAHGLELMVQKVGRLGAPPQRPPSSAGLLAPVQAGALSSLGSLPVNSVTRVLYNPTMDDMIFLLPAIAAFLLQTMAINLTALSVVRERELGTIEQLLSTPARPTELMISKMVPNLVVTFIGLMCVTFVGGYWFDVPFRGNIWLFAWLALLFAISGLGLGLLISTIAQNQKQAQMITTLVLLLSLLLTGFVYPRAPMPAVVQTVGNLIPLTYFIRITRAVYTKGVGLSFIWSDVISLAVYAGIAMLGAAITFKKRLD
ncbi:MAG TPA: ABC transporter permease [Anaerolineae bacterium]